MTKMNWCKVNNQSSEDGTVEILIYDQIGKDWFSNDGVGAKDFAAMLNSIPPNRDIIVGINSPGGNVWDGLAIYHHLLARGERVTTRVDGIAASIASIIFQAGFKRIMPENSLQMIHNASGFCSGTADDMRELADMLEKHDEVICGIYAKRTGMDEKSVCKMMDDETWMTGSECSTNGFCDECSKEMKMAASANAFDLSRFRRAPVSMKRSGDAAQPTNSMKEPQAATAVTASPANGTPNIVIDYTALAAAIAQIQTTNAGKVEPAQPVSTPAVATVVQNLGNPLIEEYRKMKPGHERMEFRALNQLAFNDLSGLGKVFTHNAPMNTNTIDSSLIPAYLEDAAINVLHNKLALVKAFTTEFSGDRMRPLAGVVVKKVTAGPTVQTDATNFESGDSTLGVVSVTMHQYTASYQISNSDLNNGFRLADLATIAANKLADKVSDIITALMVAGNYGSATTIGAAANFDSADLAPIWALAKNYGTKTLLLDGSHMAYLIPTDRTKFALGEGGAFGFDQMIENNRWTGATTNCAGFVTDKTAIALVAGLPLEVPSAEFLSMGVTPLKNGIQVQTSSWFSRSSRTLWASLDIMFGAAAADTTAAEVLVTA